MKTTIYRPMVTMLLTAALAISAAAQKQVPFKGAIQGHDVDSGYNGTTVVVTTTGTGIGTLLGEFSFTQEVTVNIAALTDTGSAHWIAANGDSIDATIVGSGEPTDTTGVLSITEIFTITGGTGRFGSPR